MANGEREPSEDVLLRFRTAYRAAAMLREKHSAGVAQPWFQGMDPQLGEVSPARLVRMRPGRRRPCGPGRRPRLRSRGLTCAEIGDADDATLYPTAPACQVSYSWLEPRVAGSATLRGNYCAVTAAESISALRPRFVSFALGLGRQYFDAAALKDGAVRTLTQAVATHPYETTSLDGRCFASRLGDDLPLWAIIERPVDPPRSPQLEDCETQEILP